MSELDRIVAAYLRKRGYKEAAEALAVQSIDQLAASGAGADAGLDNPMSTLETTTYVPEVIEESYSGLNKWIASAALDQYKTELYSVTFPLFVHCYIALLSRGYVDEAMRFMSQHSMEHVQRHRDEVEMLKTAASRDAIEGNEVTLKFRTTKYQLRLCQYSFDLLIGFLQKHKTLRRMVNDHLEIKSNYSIPRQGTYADPYGEAMEDDAVPTDKLWGALEEKPAGKPAAEQPAAIPTTPYYREALQDIKRRVSLGSSALPSVCFYTFFNGADQIQSVTVSDDAGLISCGMADSRVRLFSTSDRPLMALHKPEVLEKMDIDTAELTDMYDQKTKESSKNLFGHSGAVYGTDFGPEKNFLISASADCTVRLWSLSTFQDVACYRGHNYPVWDCSFSPLGEYFATASHDRTARMWNTERLFPLRIFAGHLSDVNTVAFHPNSNYIGTGSADRSCRLWDVQQGEALRVFKGHEDSVHCVAFSDDGKYVATGADDFNVIVWDIGMGRPLKVLKGHSDVIYSLAFCQGSSLLCSGAADNTVRTWNLHGLDAHDGEETEAVRQGEESPELLATFHTKSTPVFNLRFTRTNLAVGAGVFRAAR